MCIQMSVLSKKMMNAKKIQSKLPGILYSSLAKTEGTLSIN